MFYDTNFAADLFHRIKIVANIYVPIVRLTLQLRVVDFTLPLA